MFETGASLGARAGEPIGNGASVWDDAEYAYQLTERESSRPWPEPGFPADVDDLPPIVLAVLVHRTDPDCLPGHDRVLYLKARERLVSHHQAGSLDAIESITRCVPPDHDRDDDRIVLPEPRWEFASDEVRAALRLTRHGAEQRVDLAISLSEEYPELLAMLREGQIDLYRVRLVVDGVRNLDAEERAAVVHSILSDLPDLGGQRYAGVSSRPPPDSRGSVAPLRDRRPSPLDQPARPPLHQEAASMTRGGARPPAGCQDAHGLVEQRR